MKKFIAIAVAALMLLSVIPFTAFAAEGDPIKIVDAEGNDVATYATLQDAVNAVTDTQKIVILEDYAHASYLTYPGPYNAEDLKDVVIEGATKSDGSKVKITCARGFSDQVGCYNLTVRNLEIVNTAIVTDKLDVFMYDPYSGGWLSDFVSPTLIVDNCTISAPGSSVFKLLGHGNNAAYKKHNPFIVKVKDSTISAGGAAGQGVVSVPWNTCGSVDMTVENSTITAVGGNATAGNPETSYVFHFNPIKGGVSDFSSTFNLSIDGTSKIIANFTNTATPTGGIFRNTGGTATINLAEGAELYVNNGEGKTQNSFIYHERGTTTINDNGAVWKVGADTAKNGISLPAFTVDGEQHVWYVGETAVANPYKNETATADVVLTHGPIDPALNPDNVCYYEVDGVKTYGSSMKDLIAAAPDGVVIEVIRDFSVSGFIQWFGKNVTVDGNGYTITGTHNSYIFDINKATTGENREAYSFTLKDANLVGKAGMWFDTSTVTVEDCTFDIDGYMVFSHDGAANTTTTLTIKDTEVNFLTDGVKTDAQPFMKCGATLDTDIVINIENSKLIGASGNGTSANPNTPNNGFFNLNTAGEVEINVDATSVLKSTENTTGSIFAVGATVSKFELNLAEGATLQLDKCMDRASFIANNSSNDVIVNDNGAAWVIGADAAKAGVYLPTIKDAEGKALTWSINGVAVDSAPYTDSKATEAVTLKAIADAKLPFAMINGAGLKTEGEGLGISFGISIDQSIIDRVGPEATYGIRIAPSEYAQFGFDAINEGQYIDVNTTVAGIVEGKCILGITGFPADDSVFLKLTVIGYASYYDTETSRTVTYYTPNTVEISLYELALIAAENGYADNANVKTILAQLY